MPKHIVKCPYCQETFDRDTVENEKVGRRYYHVDCYNKVKKEAQQRAAVALRQEKVQSDREELNDLIKEKLGTEANWGAINRQIISFIKTYNYSYREIYLSLLYYFEVQKQNTSKCQGRIGIVPYVHDEAISYYKKMTDKQFSIAKNLISSNEEIVVRTINKIEEEKGKERKKLIDLSELMDLE